MDLGQLAVRLSRGADGIWEVDGGRPPAISYPEDGNARCAELEARSFWFRHRNRCILAAMGRHPPPGPLFDVGGGNGAVAAELGRHGFDVVLVEPGRAGAVNARRAGVAEVVCGTLADVGFRDGSLPGVGLFDVVEHIEDDRAFLDEVRRVLLPGGLVYLTVPAYQAIWSADDDRAGHVRRYTRPALEALLRGGGLTVEYATYTFWCLPAPIFLLRSIPSRLGMRRERDAGRAVREHGSSAGAAAERLMAWEPAVIARGGRIPVGGSILAVARKS